MIPPLALLLPVLFLGGIVSTIAGGGLGMLLTIAATFFIDVRASIVLVSLLGFIIQSAKIAHFYRHTRWDMVTWYLLLGVPCSFLGAWMLFVMPQRLLEILLGTLCLAYVAMHGFGLMPKFAPSKTTLVIIGGINGIVGGVLGHGALLRMPALLSFGLSKQQFVATSSFIAFVMNLGKAGVYVRQFPWSYDALWLFLLSVPTVFVSVALGKKLLHHVSDDHFEYLLLTILLIGAVRLLFFA